MVSVPALSPLVTLLTTPRSGVVSLTLRLLEWKDLALSNLTYAEWYQTIEKPRLAAITPAEREANANSHIIGVVDECYACTRCECKAWNTWKVACPA